MNLNYVKKCFSCIQGPKKFSFRYYGIIEAALDKFPNSIIIETYKNSSLLIETTAYNMRTIMWLLCQGSHVKVISLQSLVTDNKNKIKK